MKKYSTPSVILVNYEMFDVLTESSFVFNPGWLEPLNLG